MKSRIDTFRPYLRSYLANVTAVAFAMAPGVLAADWFGQPSFATLWFLGMVAAIFTMHKGGWQVTSLVTPVAVLFAGVAVFAHPYPAAIAALVTLAVVVAGVFTREGSHLAYVQIPVIAAAMSFAAPALFGFDPASPTLGYAFTIMGVLAAGAVWTVAMWAVFARSHMGKGGLPNRAPSRARAAYTLITAPVIGAVAYLMATQFPHMMGGWAVVTLCVLLQPGAKDPNRRILYRVIGTFIGAGIAILFVLVVPLHVLTVWVITIMLCSAAVTVAYSGGPYWLFVSFFTPAAVLGAAAAQPHHLWTVEQRPLLTVTGAVIAVILAPVIARLGQWQDPGERADS